MDDLVAIFRVSWKSGVSAGYLLGPTKSLDCDSPASHADHSHPASSRRTTKPAKLVPTFKVPYTAPSNPAAGYVVYFLAPGVANLLEVHHGATLMNLCADMGTSST
ncbi:hypothetical protein CVT26_012872 [Gymnopilus dilepis]|uniref:Uncharacterized protein n=1 Tax=Gymnopilus dilepis TaxID=231916 RepID=A0A409YNV9_9AGAR|nr:hypothetical protein CVT26_012872 [Gymnopilus dilepis]